jgi:aminoglycoside phosphotransferase (APT) family kinase protein
MNVILTADGPQIIDWEGAARGPAVADVAMTWVIVAAGTSGAPQLPGGYFPSQSERAVAPQLPGGYSPGGSRRSTAVRRSSS